MEFTGNFTISHTFICRTNFSHGKKIALRLYLFHKMMILATARCTWADQLGLARRSTATLHAQALVFRVWVRTIRLMTMLEATAAMYRWV